MLLYIPSISSGCSFAPSSHREIKIATAEIELGLKGTRLFFEEQITDQTLSCGCNSQIQSVNDDSVIKLPYHPYGGQRQP